MIPEHVMRELRYLEVYTAKKIRNLRVGAYTSPLRGSGFDFDQHQLYRPGDDVRRIDWNVTARLTAPYVRLTHAERELNVVVAMDLSRSMELGTSGFSKKEALTFITGSILFSAISDQINAGFLAFTDRVIASTPPKPTRAAAWTILQKIWALDPKPAATRMGPAFRELANSLKRMSVIFIVSDFLTDEDIFANPDLGLLATRHDVIAVVPEDPAEAELPPGHGFIQMRDLESGRSVSVRLNEGSRRRYADAARRRRAELTQAFYRAGIDHVFVRTDDRPVEPLLSLFARRMAQ